MIRTENGPMKISNKKLLVVGLARSGLAAANFLSSRGGRVTVTDLKSEKELDETLNSLAGPVRLSLGGHRHEDFVGADTIILSPGVPRSLSELQEAAARGVEIISEVELAFRFLSGSFVGVTGSNGKTTTTTLIGAILRKAGRNSVVAGNIGTPLTSFIDDPSINTNETTFVVELSSFQLETVERLKCHVALLLNITPDHMDRYPDFGSYRQAKSRIFHNQTTKDFAIINIEDSNVLAASAEIRSNLFPFSCKRKLEKGAFLDQGKLVISWRKQVVSILPLDEIRLKGEHNIENTLAAASAAFVLGVSEMEIAETVCEFSGVEHRLELVRRYRDVDYYNDSKATNVDSALRAIQAFDQPLTVIMGGLDKGTDFAPLREAMTGKIRKVILLGATARKIAAALSDLVQIEETSSLEEAVKVASMSALPGEIVLLAPACASFDMFEDFEDRGRQFKRLVHTLAEGESMERS